MSLSEQFYEKRCIIRASDAGVHMGTVHSIKGTTVLLRSSRRIYSWSDAFTLSEVAVHGPGDGSRIARELSWIAIRDACEVLPISDEADEAFAALQWDGPGSSVGTAPDLSVPFGTSPEEALLQHRCVVRSRASGVHIGLVTGVEGEYCVLRKSRRLYEWTGALTLSEVAVAGVSNSSVMPAAIERLLVIGWCELIPLSEASAVTIDAVVPREIRRG